MQERVIANHDTVPRWLEHEERSRPPWLIQMLKGARCVLCGKQRGVYGLSGAECGECVRGGAA
jgi:hypothetical protein